MIKKAYKGEEVSDKHKEEEVPDISLIEMFDDYNCQIWKNLFKRVNVLMVHFGNGDEHWLCKHCGKTGVYEVVPILPIVEEIFEKYKDHPTCIQRGMLLPILSNTHFNAYLKEITDICGIERDLNTHLAWHTFADIMLNLGMPLEDVSKMLGHKSIRTTQRYCKIRLIRIQRNFNEFVRPILSRLSTLSETIQEQINLNPEIDPIKPATTYAEPSVSSNVGYRFNYISKTG